MKKILGVSAGFHDAALTVLHDSEIVFAGHSERYSKIKNDKNIHPSLEAAALEYGPFDTIAYYERPWRRQLRKLWSGEPRGGNWRLERELIDTIPNIMQKHYSKNFAVQVDSGDVFQAITNCGHHISHAAAGFQTSGFNEAAVVVIDAIGETDTISIYSADYNVTNYLGSKQRKKARYKRVWHQSYPHSIGMFYSALTQHVGLHPMDEEYITMGMAAYGHGPKATGPLVDAFVADLHNAKFKQNLHIGFPDDLRFDSNVTPEDKAAAGQWIVEQMIMSIMRKAKHLTGSSNLVYMGGVALNCVANSQLHDIFNRVWIMPNPGDAGSSLGAAAAAYGGKLNWQGPYLGTNIGGDYPVEDLVRQLKVNKIVGVASGRAEFGPRALGNRSLLADPRGPDIKDTVNEIKRRQKFRPFAPAILAEHAAEYFDGPTGPYMQFVSKCKRPDKFPAIVHADGTSRVQAVENDGSGFRRLLEAWYKETKCPMLLNTSLNIRGEPMVDTRYDADRFQKKYGVTVCS